jgi:hypothetical protein
VLLLRVHWVKHSAYKAFFHIIFAPYGEVMAAWRDNGTSYFNIKLKLKPEMKDSIPHIMRFPKRTGEAPDHDRRRILITIAGRPPICVRCGAHDHIKYKCTAKQNELQLIRLCESDQEVLRADRARKIEEIYVCTPTPPLIYIFSIFGTIPLLSSAICLPYNKI